MKIRKTQISIYITNSITGKRFPQKDYELNINPKLFDMVEYVAKKLSLFIKYRKTIKEVIVK